MEVDEHRQCMVMLLQYVTYKCKANKVYCQTTHGRGDLTAILGGGGGGGVGWGGCVMLCYLSRVIQEAFSE